MELVDRSLVLRKLDTLAVYRTQLAEISVLHLDEYRKDWKTQRIVERTLQIIIETCVDIANHIIADGGMRAPESYADSFTVLRENNVLGADLHAQLAGMAKFRNVIVHQYDQIDAEIVVSILRKIDGTLAAFVESIKSCL
jgi:uncharacterized protein YutE (UPF0331/DUF86 family)